MGEHSVRRSVLGIERYRGSRGGIEILAGVVLQLDELAGIRQLDDGQAGSSPDDVRDLRAFLLELDLKCLSCCGFDHHAQGGNAVIATVRVDLAPYVSGRLGADHCRSAQQQALGVRDARAVLAQAGPVYGRVGGDEIVPGIVEDHASRSVGEGHRAAGTSVDLVVRNAGVGAQSGCGVVGSREAKRVESIVEFQKLDGRLARNRLRYLAGVRIGAAGGQAERAAGGGIDDRSAGEDRLIGTVRIPNIPVRPPIRQILGRPCSLNVEVGQDVGPGGTADIVDASVVQHQVSARAQQDAVAFSAERVAAHRSFESRTEHVGIHFPGAHLRSGEAGIDIDGQIAGHAGKGILHVYSEGCRGHAVGVVATVARGYGVRDGDGLGRLGDAVVDGAVEYRIGRHTIENGHDVG